LDEIYLRVHLFTLLCVCAGEVSARVVKVSPGPLIRVEGQPVSIRCDVSEYGGPQEQDFEWEMSSSSSGSRIKIISTFDAAYSHASLSKRVASGDISVERLQDNQVELKVAEVKSTDAGFYWCQTPSTDSVISGNYEAKVKLIVIPNTLRVSPLAPAPVVPEGSDIILSCNVTRELTQPTYLSVTWSVKRGSTSEDILVFGPQGDVAVGPKYARRYADGGIRLVPGKNGVFELVVTRATPSDDGLYECNGTEWTHEDGGRWVKIVQSAREMGTVAVTPTGELEVDMGQYVCSVSAWTLTSQGDLMKSSEHQSAALTVRWATKPPTLNVVAKPVREASVGGATFEMSCTVSTENIREAGYSVLIQSQDSLQSTVRTIMTLSPDSVVQHGGATDPARRDSLVLVKSGPAEFRFRLNGVQLSDRAFYWCAITALNKQQSGHTWTKVTSESNKVRIDFQENGPSFAIAIQSDASTVYPWETAKMECSLSVSGSSPKTDDLAYEVRWFFTRLRGGQTTVQVASVDRFGVLRKDARNSSSDVSVERKDTHTYQLNIHGTQDSDSGEYHCVATPWYLSASTGAWTQAAELTSSRVFLTVKFAVWESLKLPLLYGVSASVGVFSLVLGLVCAQCCCRNTTHTPRSRNKLMDLEMD
uniref:Prostaglandin F2 receptor inhibitor b n=1 Tax=Labrus bergylta TaxID=56723 RepID=A0A3Q3GL49_9LABR